MLAPGVHVSRRYRLEHLLGEGGMGVVWAATDLEAGGRVALKLIKDAPHDPKARRSFLREARAAAAVRHPNVVQMLSVLELDDGSYAMAMELLTGESLSAKLRRERRIPLGEVASILVPVASALGAAHSLGIVHRDLKPENVYLSRGPEGVQIVKVLDFGIAKLTALQGDASKTAGSTTDGVVGTPAYMSPEQVFGEKDIDRRSDIWAFGLLAYECLTGTLPTAGDNVGQVLKNVLAKPIAPLSDLLPGLPAEVSTLVDRMLCRDRAGRPGDLGEVGEVLGRYTDVLVPAFTLPNVPLTSLGLHTDDTLPSPALDTTVRAPVREEAPAVEETAPPERRPAPPQERAGSPGARRAFPRRWVLGSAGVAALLGATMAIGLAARARAPAPPPVMTAPPLEAPSSLLACPIFRASGVPAPAGWLGAAAAATACERARVILGGRPERTLVPAELLNLPRQPVDGFPADPYGEDRARERSLEEARARAAAYLDGEVVKGGAEFSVSMSLRRADGTEIDHREGKGRGLYEAVRAAMEPMVRPDAIARASELDPVIGQWTRTRDVDAALALLDLTLAIAHNAGGLPDECARFEARSPALAELGALERWRCAYILGQPAPNVDLGQPDPSSSAAVATSIRIHRFIAPSDAQEHAATILTLFGREPTGWGRSLLAATGSCLLQASEPRRAYEMALLAIQAEPKNPDGQWCRPWAQLLTVTQDTSSATDALRAAQAWAPWESNVWYTEGSRSSDPATALAPMRRAYTLSPFNTVMAGGLVDRLLLSGKPGEARSIALLLSSGGRPVHRLAGDLVLLRIDASEAQLGAALRRARSALEVTTGDAGWVRAQRFEVAWRALELAHVLGRRAELADDLVRRFLEPEPPPLDVMDTNNSAHAAALCAWASRQVSSRCFARFRALRERLSGGITPGTDAFVNGAERYSRGDFKGAAAAWRPLMRAQGPLVSVMPDAMAEVFDRAGDHDLAERLDQKAMERAGDLGGATMAHARGARRAATRGDRERARTLAHEVVEAWQLADETVPAVEEMERLLAGLR